MTTATNSSNARRTDAGFSEALSLTALVIILFITNVLAFDVLLSHLS